MPLRSALLLLLCAAVALTAKPISGVIESLDPDTRLLTLREGDDTSRNFVVGRGDASIWEVGDPVTGEIVREGEHERLQQIFPTNKAESAVIERLGRDLQRETLRRGMKAFRAVGERLPRFALWDQNGELFLSESLTGRYAIINFVFTRCMMPEMCPASTSRMILLDSMLDERGWDDVTLISVSLDPAWDSPGIWTTYAADRSIDTTRHQLLTGPVETVDALKKQLGVLAEPDEDQIVKHTMSTALVDPTGKIIYRLPGSMWSPEVFLRQIERDRAKK